MWIFRLDSEEVCFPCIRRQIVGEGYACRGDAVIGGGEAGGIGVRGVFPLPFGDVHDFDADCFLRTGAHARRGTPLAKAVMAHVALPDDAALRVVLRHSVGTVPCAVLAADANLRAVQHHASDGILGEGVHGTAFQTRRLHAVIAAHGKIRTVCIRVPAAFDLPDSSPIDIRRIAVLLVASNDAALAADAFGHVKVKAVLLAGQRRALRNS